jgi:hypothetical protein
MRRQQLRKIAIVAGAALSVALVSASLAIAGSATSNEHAKNLASKQCHAEKKADKGAFKATYGKHAMRNCKKGTTDEVKAELESAAQDCRAEREADPAGFEDTYGTDESQGRNAFGKCVSSKAREDSQEDVEEFDNAAQECKAERAEDPDAFKETYGSEQSKGKNALGKCVSSKVKHSEDDETTS